MSSESLRTVNEVLGYKNATRRSTLTSESPKARLLTPSTLFLLKAGAGRFDQLDIVFAPNDVGCCLLEALNTEIVGVLGGTDGGLLAVCLKALLEDRSSESESCLQPLPRSGRSPYFGEPSGLCFVFSAMNVTNV